MLYLWIFTSKWIKLLGHYLRYPVDVFLLPVSVIFGYLHGAIKMYAVMTLNVVCLILFNSPFHLSLFFSHFPFPISCFWFFSYLHTSVSKRNLPPMTTQHHSALIISLAPFIHYSPISP